MNAGTRAKPTALPDDACGWAGLGRAHLRARELEEAAHCLAQAIRFAPRDADAWHDLGTVLKQLGDREGAFKALKQALLLDPKRAATYFNLGNLLIAGDQFEDAVQCYERAATLDPELAAARNRLGHEWSSRGRVRRAETLFRQTLGLDPDNVQGWFGLGRTLEDLGEAPGALDCYVNVLTRRPQHAQAIGQYLGLVRDDARADIVETAQRLMTDARAQDEVRALVGYGLLKYHDRRGEYALAAQAGLAANAARRRADGPLDRPALVERVERLMRTYTRDFFTGRRRLGLGTDQPVFIVGLPRSGTTLTEQVLDAHPQMHGAGELPDLSRIAARSAGAEHQPWQAPIALDEMQSRERAHEYLRSLRESATGPRLRMSDKSPLNFFQLAFAAVLFPNARVVHCVREPRDNALSIWMENFSADQRWATDFDDLAFFRVQYERLMAHWREHLPLKMLEVRYEDTVADLEGQARRLVVFMGVPWDPACLDFHRNERAVQTPSRWQVRQPIYSKSVERWRAYRPFLPDLALCADPNDAPDRVAA